VARDEGRVRSKLKEMLEGRLAGHHEAIVWPEKTTEVPHDDARFLVAYMPLEFVGPSRRDQEAKACEFFERYGDRPRKFRNGLALAIPSDDQIEILRRSVRYLLAIEQVRTKGKQLNLTDEQKSQLKEREATERVAAESAFLKLYVEVWLPRAESGSIVVDAVAVGGRPLQTTLNDHKEAAIHARILELITQVQPRVFSTLAPTKIVDLFKLGEGTQPRMGVKVGEVVEGFYSFLGFTRLTSKVVVQKSVARGIRESIFGYCSGATPALGDDGKFQVALDKVRLGASVSDDEIDLDSGFIMLPVAIPQPQPVAPPSQPGGTTTPPPYPPSTEGDGGTPKAAETPTETTPSRGATTRTVDLAFSADRNALFTAWNALANLADMAGTVRVTVHAESPEGFDKSKLQNGVLEPLRESDLIE